MIEGYFKELGFTDNEAMVYLALAEVGKSTASLLAKEWVFPERLHTLCWII